MMSSCRLVSLAAMLISASGCAAQLSSGGGASIDARGNREARGKWYGNAAGAFVGSSAVSPRIGVELDGRHEYDAGTSWHAGVQAGVIKNPGTASRVGGSLYAEIGTPLREATLFPDGDFYAGMTAEMLIWLGGERGPNELNSSPWLLVGQPELVLRARGRSHHHFDDDPAVGHQITIDAEGGVGMRIRFISEYF